MDQSAKYRSQRLFSSDAQTDTPTSDQLLYLDDWTGRYNRL